MMKHSEAAYRLYPQFALPAGERDVRAQAVRCEMASPALVGARIAG